MVRLPIPTLPSPVRSEIFVVKVTGVALEIDDGCVPKVILKQTDPWVDFQPTPWTWVVRTL